MMMKRSSERMTVNAQGHHRKNWYEYALERRGRERERKRGRGRERMRANVFVCVRASGVEDAREDQ